MRRSKGCSGSTRYIAGEEESTLIIGGVGLVKRKRREMEGGVGSEKEKEK